MKIKLGPVSKFAEGKITPVVCGLDRISVACVNGELFAYQDSCSHDGGHMGACRLEGWEVECPRHGARFDVRTGAVTRMPAVGALETYPVSIENGEVFAEIED